MSTLTQKLKTTLTIIILITGIPVGSMFLMKLSNTTPILNDVCKALFNIDTLLFFLAITGRLIIWLCYTPTKSKSRNQL